MYHMKVLSKPVSENLNSLQGCAIHSVFKNLLNLEQDGNLISIQNSTVPKGPLSMVIDEEVNFSNLFLKVGETLSLDKQILSIGEVKMHMEITEIWDPQLKYYIKNFFINKKMLIKTIRNIILVNGKDGGIKDATLNITGKTLGTHCDESSKYMEEVLRETLMHLSNKNFKEATKKIVKLIGVGVGLTPSGDDFLVGFLSVLNSLKNNSFFIAEYYETLSEEILKNKYKTTKVSESYLQEAVKGNFSESFHHIYKAICDENLKELYKRANSMISVGHSSGTDGLCGMLWGFYTFDYLY